MVQELVSLFLGAGEPAEQIEKLLDSITDLVQSVRPDGSFAYVNRAWRETLGYSAARMDMLRVFDVIHESSRDKCRDVFQRLLAGDTVPPFETVFVKADGGRVELEGSATCSFEAGRPVMIRAVLRDVSERRRIESRLRAAEERFRKLVEESSDGIFLADSQGLIAYSSPSLERVLGFTPDELHRTSGFDLVHPDDVPAAYEYFGRVRAQPREHLSFHCRARHKDGGWRDLDVVCTNHLDDPAVEAVVVNFRDVTGRRIIEDELRHAQRLESLVVLASGIAHEFNNVLTVILGNIELMKAEVDAASPAAPLLTQLHDAGRRAADLTRQMLAYAGRTPFERQRYDVSSVVREMRPLLEAVAAANVAIEMELESAPAIVDGDPAQLRQAVMNLVANASEAYDGRGGAIVVRTAAMSTTMEFMQSPYIAPAPPPGRYVCVEVSDLGSGIPADLLPRIFEPFFTTKFIGRGLGLAAALGVVRAHQGTVHATSDIGQGTTVRMLFPVA
ncbi:MAG TPA: PAS domain S-box protein [Vicinamibacterales bacterium]|nr:PAS domain S-box protein [Vicinamibacterales bacterium]